MSSSVRDGNLINKLSIFDRDFDSVTLSEAPSKFLCKMYFIRNYSDIIILSCQVFIPLLVLTTRLFYLGWRQILPGSEVEKCSEKKTPGIMFYQYITFFVFLTLIQNVESTKLQDLLAILEVGGERKKFDWIASRIKRMWPVWLQAKSNLMKKVNLKSYERKKVESPLLYFSKKVLYTPWLGVIL